MSNRDSWQQDKLRRHIRRVGGNCHLCGRPIDYNIPYLIPGTRTPNPDAYVADHVIPLDKGGRHDASNVKPAHWSCNNTKRARIISPIIRRSGALE